MTDYPITAFLIRRGEALAIAIAAMAALLGLYLSLAGGGWLPAIGGPLAGALLYLFVRSYVEVVSIISDVLLPK